MTGTVWCAERRLPRTTCTPAGEPHDHTEIVGLGYEDEPQHNGALVAVWAGDYHHQEVWVASGANIGNWYCLGGEFGVPKVWTDPRTELEKMTSRDRPTMPAGMVPLHPHWSDILARGPVSLLVTHVRAAYREGWRNGRRTLYQEIETLAEDDSGAGPDEAL